jgi:hypothetical protein
VARSLMYFQDLLASSLFRVVYGCKENSVAFLRFADAWGVRWKFPGNGPEVYLIETAVPGFHPYEDGHTPENNSRFLLCATGLRFLDVCIRTGSTGAYYI